MAIDPRTLPDYIPGGFYDDYGNLVGFYGPYGGAPSGGPGVGYSAVGAPNSGGGAGYVGSGYGYTPAGPPVASIGGFGDRGRGISADASAYLGGDFAGAGSGDFAFGGGPTENIQGSPVANLSQNPLSPMDPNATMFDGGWGDGAGIDPLTGEQTVYRGGGIGSDPGATGGRYDQGPTYSGGGIGSDPGATGGRYEAYDWMNQPIATPDTYYRGGGIGSDPGATGGRYDQGAPIYSGGGIGADAARTGDREWGDPRWWTPSGEGGIGGDAGATRDRIAEMIASGGPRTQMEVGPENLPPTPYGPGFNMRPPTYSNLPEYNQSGTGTYAPAGTQPWMFPGYTPTENRVPFTDPNWTGWDNFTAPQPGGS